MRDILLVFSNPIDDRHDEFNDWYTNVHIRDVMRMPTATAVQRFIRADDQVAGARPSAYRYLAMYEFDDTVKCTAAHAVAMTPALPLSETFDLTSPGSYFRMRSFVTADPLADREGDVIVAEFADAGGYDLAAAARAVGSAGILSAGHFAEMGDRLVERDPVQPEVALFRLADPAAAMRGFGNAGVVPADAIVTHYRPLIARLTPDVVAGASDAERANEARARAAIEHSQHRFVFQDGQVLPA